MSKQRTNIYLDTALRSRIDEFCLVHGVSLTYFVESAVVYVLNGLDMAKKAKKKCTKKK
jgi:hypothetical protein